MSNATATIEDVMAAANADPALAAKLEALKDTQEQPQSSDAPPPVAPREDESDVTWWDGVVCEAKRGKRNHTYIRIGVRLNVDSEDSLTRWATLSMAPTVIGSKSATCNSNWKGQATADKSMDTLHSLGCDLSLPYEESLPKIVGNPIRVSLLADGHVDNIATDGCTSEVADELEQIRLARVNGSSSDVQNQPVELPTA